MTTHENPSMAARIKPENHQMSVIGLITRIPTSDPKCIPGEVIRGFSYFIIICNQLADYSI